MLETHHTYYEPGDILIRAKGLFDHMGIYLGNGMVLHNTPDKGVHTSSVEMFANGKFRQMMMNHDEIKLSENKLTLSPNK